MGLEKINDMRKHIGMSIDDLSEKSGVPKGTLSKITAGITKNPHDTVKAIVVQWFI
ncbi:MAG: helix-turn-helix domain-containing protein [Anaerotignum faecicola]